MKHKVYTIDATPTWVGLVPLLVELAANATTAEARQTGFAELNRMAKLADLWVAEHREGAKS